MLKMIKEHYGIAYAHAQLATDYMYKKEYEIGKLYIDSLAIYLDSIPKNGNKSELMIHPHKLYLNYYLHTNDLNKAKFHMDQAEKYRLLSSAPDYHEASLLFNRAIYHIKTKEYTKARSGLEKLLAKKENVSDINLNTKAEKKISEVYAIQGNYKQAYTHLLQHISTKDSLSTEVKTNTFLYYQSQFETERKDNEIYKKKVEIEILEKDKQIANGKRKILWIALLTVILVAAGIAYYIWQTGKRKRKALSDKIEQNKQELEDFTNQLIEKSKAQEALTKELEQLKTDVGEKESIKKLQDLTTTKILTQEDWYTFKQKFTTVYPRFFMILKTKGYELTKSEERLLAMEKLYLDTNQIANLLAISQDSVIRSRSRLRKKVDAPKGVPILDYLEAS